MSKKHTIEYFLEAAKKVHPTLDFSSVKEISGNNKNKIKVVCHKLDYANREHGEFEVTRRDLLNGCGCPKCSGKKFTSDDRKLFCEIKHNGKYDYTKSDFSRVKEKTIVTCPEHGDFLICYDKHFNDGCGCKYCFAPVRDLDTFVSHSRETHGDKYDYSKVEYINSHKNVTITCKKHGDFYQSPNAHLSGQGCPYCGKSKIVLEEKITHCLSKNDISFVHNFKPIWLKRGKKGNMSIDFWIPDLVLGIECQGKQHFGLGGWSDSYDFNEQFERDRWKNEKCKENGVNLVYFAKKNETPEEYIGKVFTDVEEIIEYIKYLYKRK